MVHMGDLDRTLGLQVDIQTLKEKVLASLRAQQPSVRGIREL